MKAASQPARESGSKFNEHLHALLNRDAPADSESAVSNGKSQKDTRQRDSSDGDTGEPASSKQDRPQLPLILSILTAMAPAPTVASFGLPSTDTEPGSGGDGASIPADAAVNTDPVSPADAAMEILASIQINAPAPPAETPQPELKGDLAFALRLADEAPNQEAAPPQQGPVSQQQPPILQTPGMPLHVAQPVQAEVAQTAPMPQAPVSPVPQPRGASAQSNQQGFQNSASEKQPEKEASKPERSQVGGSSEPVAELKPVRESATAPAAANIAHRETTVQTPAPSQAIAVPASMAPRAAEPANNVTPAPAAEHVSTEPVAVRTNPTSEVTDVSVTIPLPRTDSAGEERVAIRMVQRGAEIHVSVRTPDHQLTQSLRQDLGKLTANLDQSGFRTETWRPAVTPAAAASQTNTRHEFSQGSPYRDAPNPDGRSGGQNQRGAGGQKRRQQEERPRWVAELEHFKSR